MVPHVYLGGLDSAGNLALLQHLHISHVVLAIADMNAHFPKVYLSYMAGARGQVCGARGQVHGAVGQVYDT